MTARVELSASASWAKSAGWDGCAVILRDRRVGTGEGLGGYTFALTETEARTLRTALDDWFPAEQEGTTHGPATETRQAARGGPQSEIPVAADGVAIESETRQLMATPEAATILLPETFVPGIALPKGSKVAKQLPTTCPRCSNRFQPRGGVVVVEQANMGTKSRPSRALDRWMEAITAETNRHSRIIADGDDAVELETVFYMPRPQSVKRLYPSVKPDADKLLRAVQDAVAGVAYDHDSQVTDAIIRKRYADSREPGVVIRARLLGAEQIELPLPPWRK